MHTSSILFEKDGLLGNPMEKLSDIISSLSPYGREIIVLSWIAVSFALIYCFTVFGRKPTKPASRKAQQAKANRDAFKSIESRNGSVKGLENVQVRISYPTP
jgi:hypothetical protein